MLKTAMTIEGGWRVVVEDDTTGETRAYSIDRDAWALTGLTDKQAVNAIIDDAAASGDTVWSILDPQGRTAYSA